MSGLMGRIATEENYEAISAYANGELEKLNTAQLQLYSRLDKANSLIMQNGSGPNTVKKLHRLIKLENPSYSERQARKDLHKSMMLFNSQSTASKEMDKLYATEYLKKAIGMAWRNIKNPYQKALAVAKLMKEFRETVWYDKEHLELPNWSELGSNEVYITADVKVLNIKPIDENELDELKKMYADLSSDIEDVEHEEVEN
jgi:hypothetical protein